MSNHTDERAAVLNDFAKKSQFDINPTRYLPQSDEAKKIDSWWLDYLNRIDCYIKNKARSALAQQAPAQPVADADIKALYVAMHGNDEGWLGIAGSYFISGVQAARKAPVAFPFRAAGRVLRRPGHAQGLLEGLNKSMLRAGMSGEPDAFQIISEYITALEAGYTAPPAQAQPIKDHQIAQVVNQLRDIAIQFHAAEQLRARIAEVVVPLLKAQQAAVVPEWHDGTRPPFDRGPMSADKAAYFMRRFKNEEKLLGPNEQAALDFVLSMLAAAPTAPEQVPKRCEYCDGTGDVHDATGEWRGTCTMCDANAPAAQVPEDVRRNAERYGYLRSGGHLLQIQVDIENELLPGGEVFDTADAAIDAAMAATQCKEQA